MSLPGILRSRTRPVPKHPQGIRHIHLIDTAVASDNIGDEIIVEAARQHLGPRLSDAYITTSAGHDGLGPFGRELVSQAEVAILLGTNALSPVRHRRRFIWQVPPEDAAALEGKVVLLGVGANRAFEEVEPAQARFLGRLLSADYCHSVRDDLARLIVEAAGREAVNTSCPTLWSWRDKVPERPAQKADTVVFTLTKHKPDPIDSALIKELRSAYKRVVFFPQQPRDLGYLREICDDVQIEVLPPNLQAYDRFLSETETDVIGTRLHGTIRGLGHRRRVLAIAIDNRANSIGQETGLPTMLRADVPGSLAQWIMSQTAPPPMAVPRDAIETWLAQF